MLTIARKSRAAALQRQARRSRSEKGCAGEPGSAAESSDDACMPRMAPVTDSEAPVASRTAHNPNTTRRSPAGSKMCMEAQPRA